MFRRLRRMGRPARNTGGSRNRRPTTRTRSQVSTQQKAFEAAAKKAAQERMSGVTSGLKSGSAADRYNEQLKAANKSRTSQGRGRVPITQVKQPVIRPTVDPMRPAVTGHSGTGSPTGGLPALDRPIKQVKQPIVRPVVDPMRQPITRPQYNKGGSVARSRTGHTDYRKNGMFKK